MAADRLDLLGDAPCRAAPRPLERHVLEHVRDAVELQCLVPGPGIDPDADRRRFDAPPCRRSRFADRWAAWSHRRSRRCSPCLARGNTFPNVVLNGAHVVGQFIESLDAIIQIGETGRQRGPDAGGLLNGIGETWRDAPSRARRPGSAGPGAGRVPPPCPRPCAGRSGCRSPAIVAAMVDRVSSSPTARALNKRRSPVWHVSPTRNPPEVSSCDISAATAVPSRPIPSKSRRSKLLET